MLTLCANTTCLHKKPPAPLCSMAVNTIHFANTFKFLKPTWSTQDGALQLSIEHFKEKSVVM